ncbi:hypothetical protein [Natrinema marinum]|uniref:hypothetical protein n=1 Tax=Natrinema marinum TaxID=2961598 RepID=UPI0020C8C2A3|nr:hypothetical protein [Natrinema marinum]
MRRRRIVKAAALGGITLPLAGCTNRSAEGNGDAGENDGNSTESDGNGAGTEQEADESNGADRQEFSGNGSKAVDGVSIDGGLVIVDAAHEGAGDFQVRLVPGDDEASELFADSSGAYAGQTARHVDGGTYQLSVVAGGDWEVTVGQPRPTSGERPPISLSGSGNEVRGPFEFDGTHRPSGDHGGERISVNILSPTGDARAFVFHEDSIDNPPAFEYEGIGYIEIKSDGEWSVEIE